MRLFIICSIECKTRPLRGNFRRRRRRSVAFSRQVWPVAEFALAVVGGDGGLRRAKVDARHRLDDECLFPIELGPIRLLQSAEAQRGDCGSESEFDLSRTRNIIITPPTARSNNIDGRSIQWTSLAAAPVRP